MSSSSCRARQPGQPVGLPAHLVEHALQFILCLAHAVAIIAVHHEDEALCVLEVVPPQGADLQGCSKKAGSWWGVRKQ
jgi:hypothetical protein